MQKKRQELGLPQEPPHQPQTKSQKKEPPRPRPQLMKIPLIERLREENAMGIPALGLSYIHEWINPKHPEEPRRYTCELEGCKSAWGDSEDMYRHLVGKSMLHNKNYLISHLKQEHVRHYKKDELTEACVQCDKNERGMKLEKERDYSQIQRHMDYDTYKELVNRPMDWSEKKEKHGIMPKKEFSKGAGRGANLEPLGQKRKTSFGGKDNANLAPLGERQKTGNSIDDDIASDMDTETPFKKFDNFCDSTERYIETCSNPSNGKVLKRAKRVTEVLISVLKTKEQSRIHRPKFLISELNSNKIWGTIQEYEGENVNKGKRMVHTIKNKSDGSMSPHNVSQKNTQNTASSKTSPIRSNGDNGFVQRPARPIKNEYSQNVDVNQNQISTVDSNSIESILSDFFDSIRVFVLKILKTYLDYGTITREWINSKSKSISQQIYNAEVSNWQKRRISLETIALTPGMQENMQKFISQII